MGAVLRKDKAGTAHAVLSASASSRWLHCPPSLRAGEHIINVPSQWADEGTRAHELCAQALAKDWGKEITPLKQADSEYDEEMKQSDGRRTANRSTGVKQKIEVDGQLVAVRKYTNFEMSAGVPVCLRKDANVYAIVMQTLTHTVLRPINQDGSFASETVKVISNGMLNMKGAGPASIEDAIAKRFSGEYVVPADPDVATAEAAE